jgi:transcriptional regulator with XRE-family HTH domain
LELGFNQEDLAKFLELSPQQIQKYERGTNRVSASRLYGISTILKVPVSYFFDDLNSSPPSSTHTGDEETKSAASQDELQRMQRAFSKINSSKLRQEILHLIEAMATEIDACN